MAAPAAGLEAMRAYAATGGVGAVELGQVEKKDLVGAPHANIVINYVSKVTGGKLNSVVAHEFTSISEN